MLQTTLGIAYALIVVYIAMLTYMVMSLVVRRLNGKDMSFQKINISDCDFATGDLILCASRPENPLPCSALGVYYTHAMLVVEIGHRPYVAEISSHYDKVTCFDLYERLEEYHGALFYFKLNGRLNNDQTQKIVQWINQNAGVKYPSALRLFLDWAIGWETINCFRFVTAPLEQVGVLSPLQSGLGNLAEKISSGFAGATLSPYSYSEPRELVVGYPN
jgi:hypothetical protein